MATYLAPGVYRRLGSAPRRDIGTVRMDVAGFVGIAERGPLPGPGVATKDLAVRLTSWKEFQATFGGCLPGGYLAYAVRGFFENGGTTCYVVRVAATEETDEVKRPRRASLTLPGQPKGAAPTQVPPVTTLAAPGRSRQPTITVYDADVLAVGDLVMLADGAMTDVAMVVDALSPTEYRLGRNLGRDYGAGLVVRRYQPSLQITATSAGGWGNRIRLVVTPLETGPQVDEFALRITVDRGRDRSLPDEEEFYRRLSLDPTRPNYAPLVITATSRLVGVTPVLVDQPGLGKTQLPLLVGRGPLAGGAAYLQGGRDGLSAVGRLDFTGAVEFGPRRGLRVLEEIDEIGIVCVPDAVQTTPPPPPAIAKPASDPCAPPLPAAETTAEAVDPTSQPPALSGLTLAIQQAMVEQCERLRYRVAILDPPDEVRPGEFERPARLKNLEWNWPPVAGRAARFAALYYPWLRVPDPLGLPGATRRVPPSGHVAGVWGRIDHQFGVQHPPANAVLRDVVDVVENVGSLDQESLNPLGVNVLRAFPGRGLRVWGARSLAHRTDGDWRFVHVRRLMSMIEESVERSTQWAVFEPNNETLRHTLVHAVTAFLDGIWRAGGFKGATPAESFYVKCDETNNPPDVVDRGQLVYEVGVAIAAPMEFLVFEIRRLGGDTEIAEP